MPAPAKKVAPCNAAAPASARAAADRAAARRPSVFAPEARQTGNDSADDAYSRGEPTHFLLYLTSQTFVGEQGERLAAQVRAAMAAQLPIVLAHESDEQRCGCAFSLFFASTPDELVRRGLYNDLAVALHSGEHREVSMALLMKKLGAVVCTRKVQGRLQWLLQRPLNKRQVRIRKADLRSPPDRMWV